MTKRTLVLLGLGWTLLSTHSVAMAAPSSEISEIVVSALKPKQLAVEEVVMKLPLCTRERTTDCRRRKGRGWIIIGSLGIAALVVIASSGGGGESISP